VRRLSQLASAPPQVDVSTAPGARGSRARSAGGARGRRVLLGLLVALTVLVHLPALRAPFIIDDFAHAAMADGNYPGVEGPFSLYDFIRDENRQALLERGVFPWWTDSKLSVRFLRPLSSALLWTDHELFGKNALLHHLHSLLWWALASVAVYALLRQAFSRRVAWIGATVFAVAPCHALPLAWLANRDTLVSTALGTFALAAYARWREGRRARDGLAAFALFAIAMLAGEYTLGFTGYVLAMEIVRRRESIARRALGVASFAVPAVAYLVAHTALGYGARGGGFYHDPLRDFGTYAHGAPRRLGVLIAEAWAGVDDAWAAASWWALALVTVALAVILAVPITRTIRSLDVEARGRAVWLLGGSLLSLAPVLAVEPSARLLGVCMVGVSAIIAVVIERAWFPSTPEPRRGAAEATALVAVGLAFVHLVVAPVDTWLTVRTMSQSGDAFDRRMDWVRERVARDPPGARPSTIVVLRANSSSAELFAPLILGGEPLVTWRALTYASGRSLLLRTAERTIEIAAAPHPLFPVGPQDLFRGFDRSLRAGATVQLTGMRATVIQLDEHSMPRRIRFDFDRDLDDPSLLWITEGDSGFREQKPPRLWFGEPIVP
jgi:hypothetical protein